MRRHRTNGPGIRAEPRERELTGHAEAPAERTAFGAGVGTEEAAEFEHPGYEEELGYEGAPDEPADIVPDTVVEPEVAPEFEGRRARGRAKKPPAPAAAVRRAGGAVTVGALMTPQAVTVPEDATLEEAAGALLEAGARHLPVVDADQRVVGMLSDRDLRALLGRDPREWPRADRSVLDDVVANVMAPDPLVLGADAPLRDALDLFADERVGAVPVVDERDRVAGVLSYVDVLAWVRDLLAREASA